MPTYVYACKDCDHRLEVVQKMSDQPLTDCPNCRGTIKRVLFPPAVIYKGSGFYTTDYKNGGSKSSSSGTSSTETKTETKAESTSDSSSSSTTSTAPKTEAQAGTGS